ncbi:MAG TPA: hypothetical protein VJ719_10495, partial [Chthoniobacterales bacterium]|nr:hypothetical protein [Chthoniobacterales bacterium]
MKVALCHQGFATGDAIGNDIAGMYRLLEKLDLEPVVICDWHTRNHGFRICRAAGADWRSYDLIVYHHSQYWQAGDELLREAQCPIIFKYHCITPAHFFQPYQQKFYDVCRRGKEQTKSFLKADSSTWLSDSHFNKAELIQEGADLENVQVVPPFNQVNELL